MNPYEHPDPPADAPTEAQTDAPAHAQSHGAPDRPMQCRPRWICALCPVCPSTFIVPALLLGLLATYALGVPADRQPAWLLGAVAIGLAAWLLAGLARTLILRR